MVCEDIKREKSFLVKEAILNCELDKELNKARRQSFLHGDRSHIEALEAVFGADMVNIARSMLSARYRRKKRVKSKIECMLSLKGCHWVFVTLTFSDKTLSRTSAQTRRRYVARWCKRVSAIYVANVDYGEDNGREHYHAILCDYVSPSSRCSWNRYGDVDFKPIRLNSKSVEALPLYITKLTAHAVKESANYGNRIIYSRDMKIDFSEVF